MGVALIVDDVRSRCRDDDVAPAPFGMDRDPVHRDFRDVVTSTDEDLIAGLRRDIGAVVPGTNRHLSLLGRPIRFGRPHGGLLLEKLRVVRTDVGGLLRLIGTEAENEKAGDCDAEKRCGDFESAGHGVTGGKVDGVGLE